MDYVYGIRPNLFIVLYCNENLTSQIIPVVVGKIDLTGIESGIIILIEMKELEPKNAGDIRENAYISWFVEDGILFLIVKETDIFDLHMAKVCVKSLEEFTEYKPYPCLMSVLKINGISKEARDYFANEGDGHILANAMLIKSPIMKMISNFYIMVNKPRKPTKLFTDKERALEWLSQFKV